MANIFEVNRPNNKITLGTTGTTINITSHTASKLLGLDASKNLESITVGTGLDYTRPNLTLSHLGIEALTDPDADRILFWDDSETACKWLGVGNSIVITTTTIDTIQDIRTTASPQFAHLGLGIAGSPTIGIEVYNNAVNTTFDYWGISNHLQKTAGVTDYGDSFVGFNNYVAYNQSGGVLGTVVGIYNKFKLLQGDIGDVSNARNLNGINSFVDLDGGKIYGNVFGSHVIIDQEAANEVTGDIYGHYITIDADGTVGGSVYGLYLNEDSNVDYGIYQNGTADNYFGGAVGIGTDTPDVKFDVAGRVHVGVDNGLDFLSISPYTTDNIAYVSASESALVGGTTWLAFQVFNNNVGNNAVIINNLGNTGFGITPQTKITVEGIITLPKTSGSGFKVDTATPTFGFADLLGDQFARNIGASKPTLAAYNGAVKAWQFSDGDEAYLSYHIPHDYVPGTDIHLHVHWSQNNAGATGGTIDFKYFAIYAKGHNQVSGSTFTSTPITATFSSININDGDSGLNRYQQHITEVTISGASASATLFDRDDFEPDGAIELTFEMDANNLTGTPSDPFIHFVDIHYQTTGLIGTKQKAPDFYT